MRLLDFLGGNTDCLFESTFTSDLAFDLFEDYGNLNKINKKLLKVFHVGTSKSDSDLAVIGRGSEIIEIPAQSRRGAKTINYFWDKFDSNDSAIGLVISLDGKQAFSMASMSKMDKKGKLNIIGIIPSDIMDGIENESSKSVIERFNNQSKPVTMTAHDVRVSLKDLVRYCSDNDIEMTGMLVTADEERAQKGASRKEAQAGVIPLPGQRGYETYVKSLTAELRSKLKSSKIEELTNLLKRNGALAEFEYEGLTYVKYASSIDLTKLQDGGTVYIEYKANRDAVKAALNSGKKVPAYIKVYLKQGRNGLSLDIDSVELK